MTPTPQTPKQMFNLPTTESARASLEKVLQTIGEGRPVKAHLGPDHYSDLVKRCLERDALQATRPEGCWCLGLGSDPSQVARFYTCPEAAGPREEYRREKKLRRAALANRLWAQAGIPSRFQQWRLASSPLGETHPELIEALQYGPCPEGDDEVAEKAWDVWLA